MRYLVDTFLLGSLLFATGIVAAPPSPPNVPLPPENSHRDTQPKGQKGVFNDAIGDTHARYGNKPKTGGGIPYHADHVETNLKQHSENTVLPVNNLAKGASDKLRDQMIGNKPSEPRMSRDYKPPNVQDMPGASTAERKDRTTTKNLPNSESLKDEPARTSAAYR